MAKLNVPEHVKAMINLVKLVFFLFLWLHLLACIWWVTIVINKDSYFEGTTTPSMWYAPFDWVNPSGQELLLDETPIQKKYLIMLYYAILILGNNEIGPVNVLEIGVIIMLLLLSSLINS